jgi:hypothetical protein
LALPGVAWGSGWLGARGGLGLGVAWGSGGLGSGVAGWVWRAQRVRLMMTQIARAGTSPAFQKRCGIVESNVSESPTSRT